MGVWAELCQRHKLLRAITAFQNSVFYPILFAVLCTVSGVSGKYIYAPVLLFIALLVVFSALFSEDTKVFFVPMIMIYYALGNDTDNAYSSESGDLLSTFEPDGFATAVFCGIIMAVAVFARLICDGTFKRAFSKRGLCTFGIFALDVAFLLNGAFSPEWSPINLLYGAITAIAVTLFYLLALDIAARSKGAVVYACQTLVCTSLVAVAQACIKTYELYASDKLFLENWKGDIWALTRVELPWGIATIIGTVICLGIPAALYLAITRRYAIISYFCAILLVLGTFVLDTRIAMLLSCLLLLLGTLVGCFYGKNKRLFRVFVLLFAVVGILLMILLDKYMHMIESTLELAKKLLRFNDVSSIKSRLVLWRDGVSDFLSAPIFGVGLYHGAKEAGMNLYSSMYHSIFVQLLASMGLFGVIAFGVHIKQLAEVTIRRFDLSRAIILCIPFSVLAASLVDNYFFYPNFQIIYAVFLAISEIMLEESRKERLLSHKRISKGERARVVFTYVEAGKGHIVPERAVCEAFKARYGNEFEIIESDFYSEDGNEKLKKTEKLFASAVKIQNKSRVLSWLCRTGNFVCGDRFALYFLMSFTISGVQSKPAAKKKLEALDADIIFTTHWSTAFYASLCKNPPYTVMLCPDAYSNGMFNVDVNDLLIPSVAGKADADKIRMYGGGNVSAVDFPIRKEALSIYGKKSEIRSELGVGKDEFVVTMSDGGYGLANMEATIYKLLKTDAKLTLFALCGTNESLFRRLSEIKETGSIKLIPISFTNDVLKYIAAADLFCGKSGANSMAEPAFFGVPIIVTRSITYIERKIKKYYVKEIGGAISKPFQKRAAKKIAYFAENPEALDPYRKGLQKVCGKAGTDAVAELIFDRINNNVRN